jgi:hypothetical protein
LIADFTAWEDPNFAIDEQWASFYPYGQQVTAGEKTKTEVRLWNHAEADREFVVKLQGALIKEPLTKSITIKGRERGVIPFDVMIPKGVEDGKVYVLTADVEIKGRAVLREWTETFMKVEAE